MSVYYDIVTGMTRRNIKNSDTIDDIKSALNFYFKACDDLNIPIERQWRYIGIIFDQYRKGEL